jgi:predicted kinase
MQLILLAGIQASGKSTFYKKQFVDSHIRINLDMLKTRHREWVLFQACLEAKQPVVVDNTNPTKNDRARYIIPAKAVGFRIIGYHFQSSIDDALKRNRGRKPGKIIPDQGLQATQAKLEPPSYEEGFDELFTVRIAGRGNFSIERYEDIQHSEVSQINTQ